nr:hypothetical protein [Tanacetum cinerariifolium]
LAIRGYPYMCFHSIGFKAKIILRVCFLRSFATSSSQWGSSKLLAWLKDGEQGHVSVWGGLGMDMVRMGAGSIGMDMVRMGAGSIGNGNGDIAYLVPVVL